MNAETGSLHFLQNPTGPMSTDFRPRAPTAVMTAVTHGSVIADNHTIDQNPRPIAGEFDAGNRPSAKRSTVDTHIADQSLKHLVEGHGREEGQSARQTHENNHSDTQHSKRFSEDLAREGRPVAAQCDKDQHCKDQYPENVAEGVAGGRGLSATRNYEDLLEGRPTPLKRSATFDRIPESSNKRYAIESRSNPIKQAAKKHGKTLSEKKDKKLRALSNCLLGIWGDDYECWPTNTTYLLPPQDWKLAVIGEVYRLAGFVKRPALDPEAFVLCRNRLEAQVRRRQANASRRFNRLTVSDVKHVIKQYYEEELVEKMINPGERENSLSRGCGGSECLNDGEHDENDSDSYNDEDDDSGDEDYHDDEHDYNQAEECIVKLPTKGFGQRILTMFHADGNGGKEMAQLSSAHIDEDGPAGQDANDDVIYVATSSTAVQQGKVSISPVVRGELPSVPGPFPSSLQTNVPASSPVSSRLPPVSTSSAPQQQNNVATPTPASRGDFNVSTLTAPPQQKSVPTSIPASVEPPHALKSYAPVQQESASALSPTRRELPCLPTPFASPQQANAPLLTPARGESPYVPTSSAPSKQEDIPKSTPASCKPLSVSTSAARVQQENAVIPPPAIREISQISTSAALPRRGHAQVLTPASCEPLPVSTSSASWQQESVPNFNAADCHTHIVSTPSAPSQQENAIISISTECERLERESIRLQSRSLGLFNADNGSARNRTLSSWELWCLSTAKQVEQQERDATSKIAASVERLEKHKHDQTAIVEYIDELEQYSVIVAARIEQSKHYLAAKAETIEREECELESQKSEIHAMRDQRARLLNGLESAISDGISGC